MKIDKGLQCVRSLSDIYENMRRKIKSRAGIKSRTEEPKPFYENSPLVRNYVSEYEEKFRDNDQNKRMMLIDCHMIKTYFRLLETTSLDQQRPLFARMEALALMLVQTWFPRVQSVYQLLNEKSFVEINNDLCIICQDCFGLRLSRYICLSLVSLQDLFMRRVDGGNVNDLIERCFASLENYVRSFREECEDSRAELLGHRHGCIVKGNDNETVDYTKNQPNYSRNCRDKGFSELKLYTSWHIWKPHSSCL